MKRLLSILFTTTLFLTIFSSCIDDEDIFDPQQQLELEKPIIETYVRANYPNAVQYETTGLWYEIIDPGTPNYEYTATDTLNQTLVIANAVVNYTGRFVSNGTVFDQTDDIIAGDSLTLMLSLNTGQASVINAWVWTFYPQTLTVGTQELQIGWIFQNGAQPGSRFRIITPSVYAYGSDGSLDGTIPANSPLDFEIEVLTLE